MNNKLKLIKLQEKLITWKINSIDMSKIYRSISLKILKLINYKPLKNKSINWIKIITLLLTLSSKFKANVPQLYPKLNKIVKWSNKWISINLWTKSKKWNKILIKR
jgi:hypothetical protein